MRIEDEPWRTLARRGPSRRRALARVDRRLNLLVSPKFFTANSRLSPADRG